MKSIRLVTSYHLAQNIYSWAALSPSRLTAMTGFMQTRCKRAVHKLVYANGRNQFWPILEEVYKVALKTKNDQQKLFTKLGMAITDIILECEREKNSNLDMNLKCMVFNTRAIQDILEKNKIEKIFFTSRFVEKLFRRHFKDLILKYPEVELITLPSPSPRHAAMSKKEKTKIYRMLLPS